MEGSKRTICRQELEEGLLPFQMARKRTGKPKRGWLRGIREAVGIPVDEVARRLGVCRWEIRRLEKSEERQRIQLATLKRAAEGLGCELVYALVPKEGTLLPARCRTSTTASSPRVSDSLIACRITRR